MSEQNYLKNFENYLISNGKSRSTTNCYISDTREFLNLYQTYGTHEFELYKKAAIKKQLSNKTILRKFQSIKSFLTFIERFDLVEEIQRLQIPKPLNKSISFFTKEEVETIYIMSRDDSKIFTLITLLLQTGMLLNEVLDIRIEKIDFYRREIKVKNRTITLNDKAYYVLKDYINTFHKSAHGLLFQTSNKTAIKPRNARTYISRIIKKISSEKTVNDLRNTFIINQLKAGNSIEFVGNVVGHSSTQNTERYLKLVPDYKNKKLNRVVEV